MTNDELKKVLGDKIVAGLKVSLGDIRADALRLARESNTVGRTWTGGAPDDFEPYSGIGHTYEKRLYDAGICTHAALAATSLERLREICIKGKVARQPDFQSWIDQAKALAR
jgi:predicted flap endonuclease-1-like 5' DNA nuclease